MGSGGPRRAFTRRADDPARGSAHARRDRTPGLRVEQRAAARKSCFDTLDAELADGVRANIAANGGISPALTREMAVGLYGNDLDDEQTEWMLAHSLPEAGRVYEEPCDLSGLAHPIPRTWIRLTQDHAGTVDMQDGFIANLGGAEVIDLDCGHMAMISQPAALAGILDDIAART
jgi:pimeloyl-ACP methyl ester carboxylesterase